MSAVQPEVLDKIHTKIQQLEAAIVRISRTKKQLKENALMAKDGIHTTISRHLETLRNREVWLLGQVDLLEHAKEDMMRHQQAELNQAIGGLRNAMELMDDPNLVQQLHEVLQRVENVKLSPDETPNLTFRADPLALRDAIHELGQVDTRSLPIQRAFVHHESSSTSLPRSFEEYEDADHHMLYKTMQSLQTDTVPHVRVSIPKLFKDEWLMKPKPPTRLPVRPASIPSYLDKMSTDASIKNWLCQIKHEGDMEEDNDFVMTPDVASSSGSEGLPSPACPFKHLTVIANSPLTKWLKQRVSPSCPFEGLRYFQDLSNDYTDWLANYSNNKMMSTTIDAKMSDNVCEKDPNSWLHKSNTTSDGKTPNFTPFHTQTDVTTWLLSKQPSKDCTEWLISSASPLDSTTGPTSEESETKSAHLFEYFDKISNDPSLWLKKCENPDGNKTPLFDYFGKISNEPSVWLKHGSTKMITDDDNDDDDDECSIEMIDYPPSSQLEEIAPSTYCESDDNVCQPGLSFDSFFQNLNNQSWLKQQAPKTETFSPCPFWPVAKVSPTAFNEDGLKSDASSSSSPLSPETDPVSVDSESEVFLEKWLHPTRRRGQLSHDFLPSGMNI